MLEVEAAYVTAGAACGLVLTAATCMTGTDPDKIKQLPDTTGIKNEIIVQTRHRIPYDQALRTAGATLVPIEDQGAPPTEALREAINPNTAAIFYLASAMGHTASVPLSQVVAMAHAASIPVIVDAASECPPVSALSRFCHAGADLVIFSGGKSLMGPQSTGLILGRTELIAACAANGNPFAAVGRPSKVSREEVIAFLKALELYLARDHDADMARWQAQTDHVAQALYGVQRFTIEPFVRGETYIVPQLSIRPKAATGITCEEIIEALKGGEPRIVLSNYGELGFVTVNPQMLRPGEERIVAQRCKEVLTQWD
jgi:L-seryl-tRNA(Ser) seleniumtransferase